ncbi:tautomerase family protein [Aedoeadaptatus pacaensis]|uniref:tautomerase family protein n=1 Tax=Aedoeadaptatus pacaensis TaxID=1776390 RepID=UPI000838E555|nr:tautomerase family protein [Peptoniphilus pacaensis]
MPHINIKLYPGKEDDMKKKLAESVRTALAETSGTWKEGDISVSVEEIAPEAFEAKTKSSFSKEELLLDSDYINFK